MIEKLKKIQTRFGYLSDSNPLDMLDKINELVDTVNELQTTNTHIQNDLHEMRHPNTKTRSENVQDKYAEQRKWIGKLCWFWDTQEEYKFVGILGEVSDNGTYFQKDGIVSYLNCEPVKPDDDIIYKGEM